MRLEGEDDYSGGLSSAEAQLPVGCVHSLCTWTSQQGEDRRAQRGRSNIKKWSFPKNPALSGDLDTKSHPWPNIYLQPIPAEKGGKSVFYNKVMIGVPATQGRPQPGVAGQHTADSVLFVLVFYCLNCFVLFLIGFVFYGFFFSLFKKRGERRWSCVGRAGKGSGRKNMLSGSFPTN